MIKKSHLLTVTIWAAWQRYKQPVGDYSTQNMDFRQEFLVLGSKLPNAATNDQNKDTRNKGVLMKFKIAM